MQRCRPPSAALAVAVLKVKNLVIRAIDSGLAVVDGLSFAVGEGEVVRLSGASGAGKSTVALAVCGLLPGGLEITNGSVWIGPREATALSPLQWCDLRGRHVGIVFQDPSTALNPLFTCGRHLNLAQSLRQRVSREEARRRSLERLQACGLTSDAERIYEALPRELSGGQQQRVAFALATLEQPELLVVDEPTSALDEDAAEILSELLASYVRHRRAGVLLITHDHDRLAPVVTRTIVLPHQRGGDLAGGGRTRYAPGSAKDSSPAAAGVRKPGTETVPALLDVRDLVKAFPPARPGGGGQVALDRLSLTLEVHEMVAVTGPSGVGKTTLARCLAGLVPHDAGTITLDGRPLPARCVGKPFPVQIIFQNPAGSLSPLRTVGQAIAEALQAAGERDAAATSERVSGLLRSVNLPVDYAQRMPHQLSGGEQQRAAVARCLATSPRVVVADEATSSLDPDNGAAILALLKDLVRERPIGLIVITHQTEMAMRFCDRVLTLPATAAAGPNLPPPEPGRPAG